MEGRWAQLAIDAHIAHAIDYSRPVKRFIEELIFERLEMQRELSILALYPTVDDGRNVYLTDKWVDGALRARNLPWQRNKAPVQSTRTIQDKIAELKQIQNANRS